MSQLRPLTSAKTVALSYKDARNARKQKKAEGGNELPVPELFIEEDTVFNRLSAKNRPITTRN